MFKNKSKRNNLEYLFITYITVEKITWTFFLELRLEDPMIYYFFMEKKSF